MKLNICHLYGNLLNTYGDIGNIMALKYHAQKRGYDVKVDTVSLKDDFNPDKYDFVFFGGGQDYEQSIVEKDLESKKDKLVKYIENDGLMLAVCGGYQLLGQYYFDAYNKKIEGLGIFPYYTENQKNKNRFIGNIQIEDYRSHQIYNGFENHGGITYLKDNLEPFGLVVTGNGNNGEDKTEGFRYKNTFGTYLHGPLLPRNENLCEIFLDIIDMNYRNKK
ncbi:MAG: adenosylcobyric acid synthase [Peptoniphilaceae bacterium]|nr:adenosylcobyric acid synthase [Peptoniphilaceae bacterium]MDY6018318.1 adenosylcobyric acid synthase [Anaerococcus sp.]